MVTDRFSQEPRVVNIKIVECESGPTELDMKIEHFPQNPRTITIKESKVPRSGFADLRERLALAPPPAVPIPDARQRRAWTKDAHDLISRVIDSRPVDSLTPRLEAVATELEALIKEVGRKQEPLK